MSMNTEITDTIHTAAEIAITLGLAESVVGHTETTIILSNAQARRLLAMVYSGEPAWLSAPEEDGVEILHALAKTSQVYAIVGDNVMADHFRGLHGKYTHRTREA